MSQEAKKQKHIPFCRIHTSTSRNIQTKQSETSKYYRSITIKESLGNAPKWLDPFSDFCKNWRNIHWCDDVLAQTFEIPDVRSDKKRTKSILRKRSNPVELFVWDIPRRGLGPLRMVWCGFSLLIGYEWRIVGWWRCVTCEYIPYHPCMVYLRTFTMKINQM